MARYTGGRYWGFYTLQFTENNWGKKGGTVYGGRYSGFTLYSSPKIIGERKVAMYTGGRYWGFYTLQLTETNWGKKVGTVYGESVLRVLHFTVHRK